MVKKVKETAEQKEKRKSIENLKNKLQELVNSKNSWGMNEFRETWNKKNNDKIIEMVKLQEVIICRFNKESISVVSNNMYI